MEVMYFNKDNDLFKVNSFTAIFGDKKDLKKYDINFVGIEYDDNWSVRRFLNGFKMILGNLTSLLDKFEVKEIEC